MTDYRLLIASEMTETFKWSRKFAKVYRTMVFMEKQKHLKPFLSTAVT